MFGHSAGFARQINHERNRRARRMTRRNDAKAANLHQAGKALWRACHKSSAEHRKIDAVVRDQERSSSDQPQCQIGFPGATFPDQKHSGRGWRAERSAGTPDADARGVDVHRIAHVRASGTSTMKRAPPPSRFSAHTRPPALSVIWRAIESPSPEFLPK